MLTLGASAVEEEVKEGQASGPNTAVNGSAGELTAANSPATQVRSRAAHVASHDSAGAPRNQAACAVGARKRERRRRRGVILSE